VALTDVTIRKTKAAERAFKLFDGSGLYLLVTRQGSKYWRFKYQHAGKEKLLAIGVYPEVTLAEARAARDAAKRALKEGQDPVAHRKMQRQAAELAHATTFELVAREWWDKERGRWKPAHAARVLNSLENDIFPELGARPISQITAPELLAALRKVEKREALETAQRVLQRCGSVFRYGIATGRCTGNPAADLRGALKSPVRENFAALSEADLPEFQKRLAAYDGRHETKLAIRILMRTFVRTVELRGAEWTELDEEKAEWRIPAARMKAGVEHIVPLSRQVLKDLAELRLLTGQGTARYLFPHRSKLTHCMSENTILYTLYRLGYHSQATGHGFRTTASTALNESGLFNSDAIERQLAHGERDKVRAAYNKAEYLPERRRMMQWWSDRLDALAAGRQPDQVKRAA
jgi:integrase